MQFKGRTRAFARNGTEAIGHRLPKKKKSSGSKAKQKLVHLIQKAWQIKKKTGSIGFIKIKNLLYKYHIRGQKF